MRLLALLAVGSVVGPWSALAAQSPADTLQLVDRVFADVARTDTPGCAVGIDRGGAAFLRKGYGMASLESGAPMTELSVVESGSVAKQFTAGAIALLARQGRLDLDDPVRKHIPELPDYGSPVTVRMLLHHTSGVRDMWTLFSLAGRAPGTTLYTMDEALRMVYRQKALNFAPNSEFLYSNSGYLLLAEVVARVTGKPLADYSQEAFFQPLGMTRTQWRDDWNRVVPGRVTAYASAGGRYRVDMPYMSVYGAGGLLTTVGDLLLWNANLEAPKVGDRAWVDAMEGTGKLVSGRDIGYGLGLFATTYRGEREVSHGGATGGYRTFLARWPNRKLSVAVLCNASNANPDRRAHQIADIFLGPRETAAQAAPAAATRGDYAAFAGRFRAPATEELITLAVRDGILTAQLGGGVALNPAGPDRFTATAAPVTLQFRRNPAGAVAGLALVMADRDTVQYEPVSAPPATAAELAGFAGGYYSDELDVTYTVAAKDSTLSLKIGFGAENRLTRTGRDSFAQAGGMAIRFTRGRGGRVDGLLLFAGRVKNLRFERR